MRKESYLSLLPQADNREYDFPAPLREFWKERMPDYWRKLFEEFAMIEPFLGLHSLVNLGIHAALVEWYLDKARDSVPKDKARLLRGMVWGHLFHDLGKVMMPVGKVDDLQRVIENSGDCCEFSRVELEILRKQHPWLGGYGLLFLESIMGRVPGIEWGEEWAKLVFGHHEKLDGLPVKSYPRGMTRETDPWMLLTLLFAQLADGLSANVLDRPYRDINLITGRRNLGPEETLRWLEMLLDGSILKKIFGDVEEERLDRFRNDLLGFLTDLEVELETRFSSEVCLNGVLRFNDGGGGLIARLREIVVNRGVVRDYLK